MASALKVIAVVAIALPLAAVGFKKLSQAREAQRVEDARLAAEAEAARARAAQVEQVRARLIGVLKDPQSAQLRDQSWVPSTMTLCGQVNAKNSFGGYVGFKRFIAMPNQVLLEGGSFGGFDVRHLKVPDYIPQAMAMVDAKPHEHVATAQDVFNLIWEPACTGAEPLPT